MILSARSKVVVRRSGMKKKIKLKRKEGEEIGSFDGKIRKNLNGFDFDRSMKVDRSHN